MPLRISLLVTLLWLRAMGAPPNYTFLVAMEDPGPWPAILSSAGILPADGRPSNVFVLGSVPTGAAEAWLRKIEQGAIVVLQGNSDLTTLLGIHATEKNVTVRSLVDEHAPQLAVVWEKPLELPVYTVPADAHIFVRERWENAPLLVGLHRGKGSVLWLATSPGKLGYERFPYLIQALVDLGLQLPFQSARLWAFFDSAYRSRVDLDYFAARWRQAGIAALQVAAWHYFEPDADRDAYLGRLIEACHSHGILVYAWLELPHVSEQFWSDHPEWREKTALLQDAQLDWRKLMNLQNPAAFRAASTGVSELVKRFDWDGVNLAELYFESLEGAANPARFTPMNDDVRSQYKAQHGVDPLELFRDTKLQAKLPEFLAYRAGLAKHLQESWIAELESARKIKPHLDFVLTQVDDQFDKHMRDAIGADAAGILPVAERHNITFLIEDPATVWNLGSQRYPQIAALYRPLAKRADNLAIDINIAERYQDVYPTKQQTGTELLQLVHSAAAAFPRVALYFENSILPPDLHLLGSAAASVSKFESHGASLTIASSEGVGLAWVGQALVDGRPWPVRDGSTVWLPPGEHVIAPSTQGPALELRDFNGTLHTATAVPNGLTFSYESKSRALATLSEKPTRVEVDGEVLDVPKGVVLLLPRGQHIVTATQ
jgi:hypothetical protein